MTPGPGIEPGAHWWEASALTTAPSLLPQGSNCGYRLERHDCVATQPDVHSTDSYGLTNSTNSDLIILLF